MSVLKGVRGYLGGPIEMGDPTVDWRVEPKKVLRQEFGLNLFDPFEDPKQQWSTDLALARQSCNYERMREIAADFVSKDLTVVSRSDLLISYLPYGVPTTGTHHEIIHSNSDKKPTLLVCPQGRQYIPLWYYGFNSLFDQMFGSWDELYEFLREVDRGMHKHNRKWRYIYKLI